MTLLSPTTLAYIRGLSPQAAAHLQDAADMTPPPRRTRRAPRQVIDNRRQLAVIMQNGRIEPAGDEEVIEGEFEEWD